MNGVINLKKRKMSFETKSLHVIVPLDPIEGEHYTEAMRNDGSDEELDCIYKITAWNQDQLCSIVEERTPRRLTESYLSEASEEDEQWHNLLRM